MTMLSFRVEDAEAEELRRWADAMGMDRSALLREALHRELLRLRSEEDAALVERMPLTEAERSLSEIADWGPAEGWTDWRDETR